MRSNEQKLRQALSWFRHNVEGKAGRFSKYLSQFFVTDCLKFKKWNEKSDSMHAVSTKQNVLKWNWLCYGTFCHKHNDSRRYQNDPQNAAIMLKYYYLELVGKGFLKAHNDNCRSLIKLLCRYFSYFIHGQPYLTIFFSKNDLSLRRSPLD